MRAPLFLLVSAVVSAGQVFAQPAEDGVSVLADRLERIERRIVALEEFIFSDQAKNAATPAAAEQSASTGNSTLLADMEVRMQEMESESKQLYGGVEELGYGVQQLAEKVEMIAKDIELRLQDVETTIQNPQNLIAQQATQAAEGTLAADGAEENAGTPRLEEIPTDITPEEHYERAYGLLTAAAYPRAQQWLEVFLERYPEHQLADNAHYWLGEVYLVQNNPQQAIIAFSNGLQNFPQGGKAPANLLKMGVSFQRMGQNQHAQSAWNKLLRDFPEAPEAKMAQTQLDSLN